MEKLPPIEDALGRAVSLVGWPGRIATAGTFEHLPAVAALQVSIILRDEVLPGLAALEDFAFMAGRRDRRYARAALTLCREALNSYDSLGVPYGDLYDLDVDLDPSTDAAQHFRKRTRQTAEKLDQYRGWLRGRYQHVRVFGPISIRRDMKHLG